MVNYFNFKQFSPEHLLITNDFGAYSFVTRKEMRQMMSGSLDRDTDLYDELRENGFILSDDMEELARETMVRYRGAKSYLFSATALHIFVLTNACNLNCVYCQAREHDKVLPHKMSMETAEKSVDIALQSPERMLNFEFQGGEPLMNFEVLKHIVEYAESNKGSHEITYSVVTNLTLLTDDIMAFFKEHDVRVSTSLDGPICVHDANRSNRAGEGSYEKVIAAINRLKEYGIPVGAIQTTTRKSLGFAKAIVDTYYQLGFDSIFIRPLTKLGTAIPNWDEIGYTAEEFLKFYSECIEYILEINKNGGNMVEGHATIFLAKILRGSGQNYMELRSPCGAAVGQMAYYFNGDVYTCDEGRMLAEMGDNAFRLGNVFDNTYEDLVASPVCKTVCLSSTLECLPECAECVYQPYCGTCPALNYASQHNVFKRGARGYRCMVYKGMLDTIFAILYRNDPVEIEIIKNW